MKIQTPWLTVALLLASAAAFAQPPGFGRPRSPALSPYLNLLNDNNTPEFNYYQLYRPQTEFRGAYQGLSRSLYQTDVQLSRQGESIEQIGERLRPGASLRTTGHPTSFMSYGTYFPATSPGAFGGLPPTQR